MHVFVADAVAPRSGDPVASLISSTAHESEDPQVPAWTRSRSSEAKRLAKIMSSEFVPERDWATLLDGHLVDQSRYIRIGAEDLEPEDSHEPELSNDSDSSASSTDSRDSVKLLKKAPLLPRIEPEEGSASASDGSEGSEAPVRRRLFGSSAGRGVRARR